MPEPAEPPPSYEAATGSSDASTKPKASSHLEVPQAKNGIPAEARRSMEDLQRPLPRGWVRQYDSNENHQFFVDTTADPPRSYWEHPLDNEQVLKSLSSEERERLQDEESRMRQTQPPPSPTTRHEYPPLPERPTGSNSKTEPKKSFGEKFKDKVTGTTHDERVQDRQLRDEEERRYYEAHVRFREAQQRAQFTGQPQFFARDRDGREIYIEPPNGPGYGGYGGYGINPYTRGLYGNPNVRFVRPAYAYNRPYGPYRGGGLGLPVAGGLLGGVLLGGLLF